LIDEYLKGVVTCKPTVSSSDLSELGTANRAITICYKVRNQ
jgi:hypothetical protein